MGGPRERPHPKLIERVVRCKFLRQCWLRGKNEGFIIRFALKVLEERSKMRSLILAMVFGVVAAVVVPAQAADKEKQGEVYELGEDWKKIDAPDPASKEGQLFAIRKLIASDEAQAAITAADAWIKTNPRHRLTDHAYFLRGDAKLAIEHYHEALFDYEYLVRQFPGSKWFDRALEREFQIARAFAHGTKRLFLWTRSVPAYDEAEELFVRIWERREGSDLAERALFELAEMLYRQGYMRRAVDAYDMFLVNYPKSQWGQRAMKQLVQAALATFKGPRYDPTGLIEARRRLQLFQEQFPAAAANLDAQAILNRVDESMGQRSLAVAQWYERNRKWVSARFVYQRLLKDSQLRHTAAARQAWRRLEQMGYKPKPIAADEPKVPAESGPDKPKESAK
jgi:outer membrane protein assembly factor BamD (BamD/ComL family)